MSPIRVLVADDHPVVLTALVDAVNGDPRLVVVATAASGGEALQRAREVPADIALLDVRMPGGGVGVTRALLALPAPPVVVAISADPGSAVARDMLAAGAKAFLVKGRIGGSLPDLLSDASGKEAV